MPTTTETRKEIVRQSLEAWDERDMETVEDLHAADLVSHGTGVEMWVTEGALELYHQPGAVEPPTA